MTGTTKPREGTYDPANISISIAKSALVPIEACETERDFLFVPGTTERRDDTVSTPVERPKPCKACGGKGRLVRHAELVSGRVMPVGSAACPDCQGGSHRGPRQERRG